MIEGAAPYVQRGEDFGGFLGKLENPGFQVLGKIGESGPHFAARLRRVPECRFARAGRKNYSGGFRRLRWPTRAIRDRQNDVRGALEKCGGITQSTARVICDEAFSDFWQNGKTRVFQSFSKSGKVCPQLYVGRVQVKTAKFFCAR